MGILKNIISLLFLFFQAIHATNDCTSGFCGNNQFIVRFPFRLQNQQPQICGYPGFDLSCTILTPEVVLNLPYSGDFFVRDINYAVQEITLYDQNGCLPRRLLNLNLSSSPFMASSFTQNFTFLNCPSDFIKGTRLTIIECLSNSTVSVLATSSRSVVRSLTLCSIIGTFQVPVSWPQDDDESFSSDLNEDLRLTWNIPNCGDCESRGGICVFQNRTSNQIFCFDDPGEGGSHRLRIFKIIALSIAIPAITCSICISCFICMVERRHQRDTINNPAIAAADDTPSANTIVGLDDSIIESYTKVVIGESRRLPGPNGTTCPICLVDYYPKDIIRCIPQCEHCFHSDCVDEWLRLNSTCPLCRSSPSQARANT